MSTAIRRYVSALAPACLHATGGKTFSTIACSLFPLILVAGFGGDAFAQATVPGAPVLREVDLGNGQLTVTWRAPENTGSGITRYKVTADPGTPDSPTDDTTCPSTETGGTATTCTLTGLTNGTAYTVRVVATNSAGDSTPSFSVAATPSIQDAGGRIYVNSHGDTAFYRYPKLGSTLTAVVEGSPGIDGLPEYLPVRIYIDTQDNVDVVKRYLNANGGQRVRANTGYINADITANLIVPLSNQPGVERVEYRAAPLPFQFPANPDSPAPSAPPANPDSPPVARALVPPIFTDSPDPQRYRQGKAIEPLPLPAASAGDGTLTYALTPDLPAGLTFNAETLVVSGTPTEASEKAIYTLTVTDEEGTEATVSFFLTVMANVAPSFEDANVSAQSYLRKQEITSVTLPQASGGDGTLTYSLTPDLPEGLSFDALTRIVSGIPLEAMGETTYTLTATDGDGDVVTLMFTLEVIADPVPTFGETTIAAQSYRQHREIDPLTLPQASGGDGTLTYALTPDLPAGLSFDAETRIVSGTPTEAMGETTYTLTVTDSNGDVVTLRFPLEIPDLMPSFGETTIAAQSYLVNQPIASLTFPQASGGDGSLVYILLPFPPNGLQFDSDTRTLSGTPSQALTATEYTFSALDTDGDVVSLSFLLAVQMPSSDLDGDGTVTFADFLTFAGRFGSRRGQEQYDARCDLDGDGEIGFADFLIFAARFGATS